MARHICLLLAALLLAPLLVGPPGVAGPGKTKAKEPAKAAPKAAVPLEKLAIPAAHPRILITPDEVPSLRARIQEEPAQRHWQRVVALSVGGGRQVDAASPFSSFGGQQPRCFALTEFLECSALHALLADDEAPGHALSEWLEKFDPAAMEALLPGDVFMPRGEFLEGFATCYDWAHDRLSEAARRKLREVIEKHAAINHDGFVGKKSWEAGVEANNHSMAAMGAVGLAGLALWHELPAARNWAALARDKARAWFAQGFDADGAYFEGNLYGPFGLARILPYVAAITRYGHEDLLGEGRLERMMDQWCHEIVPGASMMLPINDSDGRFLQWPGVNWLYAAVRYRHSGAAWAWDSLLKRNAGNTGHTWPYALLWDEAEFTGAPPTALERFARGRGLSIVRTGWQQGQFLAAIEAGKRLGGCHCQGDHGSFLIHALGEWLAADSGYSNKTEPDSANQSLGHNVVLVDGKGQFISGGGAFCEAETRACEVQKSVTLVHTELGTAYGKNSYNPLKQATRALLVMRDGDSGYVVVADCFDKGGGKHDYDFLLHGNATSKFETETERAVHLVGAAALDIVPVTLDGTAPVFSTVQRPSNNFGEHPMLRARISANRFVALTVLYPRKAEAAPVTVTAERKGGKLALKIVHAGGEDRVTLAMAGDRVGSLDVERKPTGGAKEKAAFSLK